MIGYQRLSPKICEDRDYTLRVSKKSWPGSEGDVSSSQWETANELGPPEQKGVVRVKVCNGTWLLEPDGTAKTRATYSIYSDTGGFPGVHCKSRQPDGNKKVVRGHSQAGKGSKVCDGFSGITGAGQALAKSFCE